VTAREDLPPCGSLKREPDPLASGHEAAAEIPGIHAGEDANTHIEKYCEPPP
jgi:hypothetical protein